MNARALALSLVVACGTSESSPAGVASVPPAGSDPNAPSAAPPAPSSSAPPSASPSCATTTLSALTAHNTSASPTYDAARSAANFGAATWVSQAGATLAIDATKVDFSLNPVTPGHVSNVDVHTLVPSRPDLRWFAHITPWFRDGGGGGHVDIGLEANSASYVHDMIADMRRRGFDGLVVDWYGSGSYEDQVTLLVQKELATLPASAFSFVVMMDKGIAGLSADVLGQQIEYVETQYFADAHYEREGGAPILMFFGVEAALGGAAMASAKAAHGAGQVWVAQGANALANDWVDQAFDWTHDYHDGPVPADPYDLDGVRAFYASVGKSTKKAFGSMAAGFDGTLTKNVAWSKGKYLPRGDGACIVEWAKAIDAAIPANVTRMQWATWSDWEEGTEIESGVENGVTVAAKLTGSTLGWEVSGDASTIDHFEVWASSDGASAIRLATVAASSFDMATATCLPHGAKAQVYVDAIGRPNIRDHVSAGISWVQP